MWLANLLACAALHRYPDGSGLTGQLDREIVALRLRSNELEDQAAGAPSTRGPDPLATELHQIFSGTDVRVTPIPGGAAVTVPAEVVFADRAALRLRGESTMVFDLLATALEIHPDYAVTIVGHTSDRAVPRRRGKSPVTPLEYTVEQSLAFASHLEANHGVSLSRVTVAGCGDHRPIASNDLPEGQDANERLEIRLEVSAEPPSR